MNRRSGLKIVVAVLLALSVAGVFFSPLRSWLTVENLSAVIQQIASLWYAPIVFIVAFAIACVLWAPASVFLIAAGVIWGWQFGFVYAVTGALLGAILSYYVARFLGAGVLARFGGARIVGYLDSAGFQTLLILRLVPLFPFAVLNYGAGVAGVRPRDFVFATTLGILPSMLVVTYSADAIAHGLISKEAAFQRFLIIGFGFAALVVIPLLLKKRAARVLRINEERAPGTESR